MRRTTMHVGDRAYALSNMQDIDAVKDRTVAAVRSGGDFVTVTLASEQDTDILISTHADVSFDTRQIPERTEDDDAPIEHPDIDHYLMP